MKLKYLFITIVIQIFLIQPIFAATSSELFDKGRELASQGKHNEAIKFFEKAIERKPGSNYNVSLVHYNIGLSYSKLGDRAKSIPSYTASIHYYQKNPLSFLNRGNDYRFEGKIMKAVDDLNKAIALDDNLFFAYNSRGVAYLELNEVEKALSDFRTAIQINPQYTNAFRNRAKLYFQTNQFRLALKDIETAISLGVRDAWPYNMAAWIYATSPNESLRNADQAVNHALKAVEIKRDIESLDTLAAAYAEQGKFDLAIQFQKQAIQMIDKDANQETVMRYKNRLKAYKSSTPWRDESLME